MAGSILEFVEALWSGEASTVDTHPVHSALPEFRQGEEIAPGLLWYKGIASCNTIDTGDGLVMFDTGTLQDRQPLFEAVRRHTHAQALEVMGKGATFQSLQHESPARIDFYRARIVDGLGQVVHERLFAIEIPENGDPRLQEPGLLGNFVPAIMTGGGETVAIGGAGGRKIIPAVFQILALMNDRGLDLEAAFRAPRLDHSAGKAVVLDARLDEAVKLAVGAGHPVVEALPNVSPYPFTIASAVGRRDGVNTGVTDIEHPWSEAVGEDDV